jgi:hypothetical protein
VSSCQLGLLNQTSNAHGWERREFREFVSVHASSESGTVSRIAGEETGGILARLKRNGTLK